MTTININGTYGAKVGNIQVFTRERAVEVFQMFAARCYANLTMESSAVLGDVADDMLRLGFTPDELEALEIGVLGAA